MFRRQLTACALLILPLSAFLMAQSPDTEAFLKAADEGDVATVRAQLERGQDVNATGPHGYTALMFAVKAQHDDVALLLLERGADPNIADPELGQVPLMFAGNVYRYEKKGLFGMILEQKIESRSTPVMAALVGRGANINTADRDEGRTPLFFAVETSNLEGVQYLISQGANVNAKDWKGKTPLMLAAKTLSEPVARALCAAGADANVEDLIGRTAAHVAGNTEDSGLKGDELKERRRSFLAILETCSDAVGGNTATEDADSAAAGPQ